LAGKGVCCLGNQTDRQLAPIFFLANLFDLKTWQKSRVSFACERNLSGRWLTREIRGVDVMPSEETVRGRRGKTT